MEEAEATAATAAVAAAAEVETNANIPQCCCGRPDCPFLARNNATLAGLERDVQTAARMGQVS